MNTKRARQLLQERRTELTKLVGVATEQGSLDEEQRVSTGEIPSTDTADLATDTLEREVDLSVREGLEAAVADVERALERLDNGRYGVCLQCGRPIDDERLEARPEAEYCVEHQPRA
jgi:RNA polymerase-binding protein DksA